MKAWIERLLIFLGLIVGNAVVVIIFLLGFLLMGSIASFLSFQTIDHSSPLVVGADVAVILLIAFILTRRKIREGLRELWKQILRNM